ncbi:MAG: aminoacyl-tRNA hydrolase [Candidatus Bipolaricaulia bacterium]
MRPDNAPAEPISMIVDGRTGVFGLGNPGEIYKNTRHNIGFMVVDRYLERHPGVQSLERSDAIVYPIGRTLMVKPTTYMNRSGIAVSGIVEAYELALWDCLIIHDDVDIEFGRIKAVMRGGPGTHRGVRSIVEALGTEAVPRLKVGIGGARREEREDLIAYVLSEFELDEQKVLPEILGRGATAVACFIEAGIEQVMNDFNQR